MDKGELYRMALAYLGTYEYVPGSAEVRALDDVCGHVLRQAGGYARWRWALRREVVQLDSDGAARLPGDFVEMERCSLSGWEVLGNEVVARDGSRCVPVELVFVSRAWADSCELPEHAPVFCEGCALLLAAKAAVRVTGNFNLAAALEERAREAFYRARLAEARQQSSNDQLAGEEVDCG